MKGFSPSNVMRRAGLGTSRRIRAKGYTDNVVDLMSAKLRRLPATTQAVLKRLACLGSSAPIATLALVQRKSEDALHASLSVAVRARLLLRQQGSYRFPHDRVREAAYALIPKRERGATHLTIGRLARRAHPAEGYRGEHVRDRRPIQSRGRTDQLREGARAARRAEPHCGPACQVLDGLASALTTSSAGAALLAGDAWDAAP